MDNDGSKHRPKDRPQSKPPVSATVLQYTTVCPACKEEQKANPSQFKLAAGKLLCVNCGSMFDAKKHQLINTKNSHQTVNHQKNTLLSKPATKTRNLTFFYSVIVLFAVILAALQLAFFNRSQWSQIDWMKPLYSQVYIWLSHQAPASEIYTQLSFSIKPDTTYQNASAINFSFTNKTAVNQNLPIVKLIFSDLKGNLVSQRVFSPNAYLKHLPKVLNEMQPLEIITGKLVILQTAKRGLNYQIELLNQAPQTN